MALITKENPVGADYNINQLQFKIYNELDWTKYESYHRAYKNVKDSNVLPEVYIGGGDYKEVLFDDTFNVTSFFLLGDTRARDSSFKYTTTASIIFQADLSRLFPEIRHRADEELKLCVLQVLEKNLYGFTLTDVISGVNNVYSDLGINSPELNQKVNLTDMSNFHVVKFDMDLAFTNNYCGSY